MVRYKRILLILFISIVIYFVVFYIYNNYINANKYQSVYILKEDYNINESITLDKLDKIYMYSNSNQNYLENFDNLYLNSDYNKNTILSPDMVSSIKVKTDLEDISVKVEEKDIKKGDSINLYYTADYKDVSNIINSLESSYMLTNDTELSSSTICLLKEIRVFDVINEINNIVIKVDSSMALVINSLRYEGKFNVGKVR